MLPAEETCAVLGQCKRTGTVKTGAVTTGAIKTEAILTGTS
jgi:hypothetical protein